MTEKKEEIEIVIFETEEHDYKKYYVNKEYATDIKNLITNLVNEERIDESIISDIIDLFEQADIFYPQDKKMPIISVIRTFY